ncbi:NAD(+) synthase [Coprothermobacter platensis]|uniref:NAD(+) synthase n=1 Tax=Coprothermobacter platensis TaxID=108819 RepID=UPI00036D1EB0|nr:NAD(+) synthase [Coprothermobacter platensis]
MGVDARNEIDRIVSFLRSSLEHYKKEGFVVGISGGLDSAAVLKLLLQSVDRSKIQALVLPEKDTQKLSTSLALDLLKAEHVDYKVLSLTPVLRYIGIYRDLPLSYIPTRSLRERLVRKYYDNYTKELGKPVFFGQNDYISKPLPYFYQGIAYYRIKHRVRTVLLYYYAEQLNYLVAGCTNLTERRLGYYVRFGDDLSDIAPIAHLYKTEVRQLSQLLGVPKEILDRPPTPDLLPGITDEYSMGATYDMLDGILVALDAGLSLKLIKEKYPEKLVDLVREQIGRTIEEQEKPLMLERLQE